MQEQKQNNSTKEGSTELARRILQHLQANPQARDTLEGIVEWWLLQERIEEAVEQVLKAITWLVTKGYLLEKKVPGSRTLYEINPSQRDEIGEFLRNAGDANP
ncbi:hypothetical protein L0337_15225 [candidate division KSB1 bacterium]|nr:hypothetical protein [candidate division KSB1 bacterium]